MNRHLRVLAGAAAFGALLAASTHSLAQEPPAGAPPSAEAMRQHWAEHRQERAEARAKALHDILRIRPDQDGAFQAFLSGMKPPERNGGPGAGRPDHQDMAALTTPQRLDRTAERMARHQAEFQRRAEAVRRFYVVLSPDQQRAFDALHGLMGDHRHGARMGHGEHGPKQAA